MRCLWTALTAGFGNGWTKWTIILWSNRHPKPPLVVLWVELSIHTAGRRTFRLPDISIDPDLNSVLTEESGIEEDILDLACMTHATLKISGPPTDARPVLSQDSHFAARHKSTPINATLRPYATFPYRKTRRPPAIYSSDIQVVVERRRADGGEESVLTSFWIYSQMGYPRRL